MGHFKRATKAKGQSVVLYDDPEKTYLGDKQMLNDLNYKILQDSNYPLPHGYYKVNEK